MPAGVHSSPEVTSHAVEEEEDEKEDEEEEDEKEDEEEEEEDLELGLCLAGKKAVKDGGGEGGFCRILTAEDFPSMASPSLPLSSPSSSSDSSSTSLGYRNKRAAADSYSPEAGAPDKNRRLVGWPPVGAHRMINLFKQSRGSPIPDAHSAMKKTVITAGNGQDMKSGLLRQKSTPLFIKVNKDGDPIGRKVDVNAHTSYNSLSRALEDMFQEQPSLKLSHQIPKGPRLLDGKSDYVLTYEDGDGDWMLLGDVPWRMFLGTVRRLRIMRRSDANGFG